MVLSADSSMMVLKFKHSLLLSMLCFMGNVADRLNLTITNFSSCNIERVNYHPLYAVAKVFDQNELSMPDRIEAHRQSRISIDKDTIINQENLGDRIQVIGISCSNIFYYVEPYAGFIIIKAEPKKQELSIITSVRGNNPFIDINTFHNDIQISDHHN